MRFQVPVSTSRRYLEAKCPSVKVFQLCLHILFDDLFTISSRSTW
jgi:hypothetical protein